MMNPSQNKTLSVDLIYIYFFCFIVKTKGYSQKEVPM